MQMYTLNYAWQSMEYTLLDKKFFSNSLFIISNKRLLAGQLCCLLLSDYTHPKQCVLHIFYPFMWQTMRWEMLTEFLGQFFDETSSAYAARSAECIVSRTLHEEKIELSNESNRQLVLYMHYIFNIINADRHAYDIFVVFWRSSKQKWHKELRARKNYFRLGWNEVFYENMRN